MLEVVHEMGINRYHHLIIFLDRSVYPKYSPTCRWETKGVLLVFYIYVLMGTSSYLAIQVDLFLNVNALIYIISTLQTQ